MESQSLIVIAQQRDEAHRRYAYLSERGKFTDYTLMQFYLDLIKELEVKYQQLKGRTNESTTN